MRSLRTVLQEKRILVCAGSGGVGKTTTAAAIALEAARTGRKSLVLASHAVRVIGLSDEESLALLGQI